MQELQPQPFSKCDFGGGSEARLRKEKGWMRENSISAPQISERPGFF